MEVIPQNKAIFIDRDGTINRDVPYCSRPEDFELLPGVGEGIKLLKDAGYKIIIITNQSGIARGFFTREILEKIHEKMKKDLAVFGASINAIYYCPHHPDANCDCRKPEPKMIIEAARDLNIDLSQSYIIGDSNKDTEAGTRAGCKRSLKIGHDINPNMIQDTFISFLEAVKWILMNQENISINN